MKTRYKFLPKNNKGDTIAQMILVIGTVIICTLSLLSFNLNSIKVRNSFVGLGLIEQLNSQIEENYFYEKTTGTGKITDKVAENNLIKSIDYASKNRIVNRKCNCVGRCDEYASFITSASSKHDIPNPLLLLALMMQESDCVHDAISYDSSSYGIMQINAIHCGKYGLTSNTEECKKELMNNPEKNIEIGATILEEYYNRFGDGKEFYKCITTRKIVDYSGWEAALRGYNGWGMKKEEYLLGNYCPAYLKGQEDFVEEVMRRYNILKGSYIEKEKSTGILWWKKTTIDFSVEYKGNS